MKTIDCRRTGPDVRSAQRQAGPFAVATTSVSSSVSGFGGGTVY
jgi:hypothetical protein